MRNKLSKVHEHQAASSSQVSLKSNFKVKSENFVPQIFLSKIYVFKNILVPIKTLDVDSVDNFTLCLIKVVRKKKKKKPLLS